MIDIQSEIDIAIPRSVVAAYAADLRNAPAWYGDTKHVAWETPPPMGVGTRVTFVVEFLGRRLSYTYEVVEFVAGERLVMRTTAGAFPMEAAYLWESTVDGGTRMRLRNRGTPPGIFKVVAPVFGRVVARSNAKNLRKLKEILEARRGPDQRDG